MTRIPPSWPSVGCLPSFASALAKHVVLLTILSIASVSHAADSAPQGIAGKIRPTKIWSRSEPLGETPKHVTDAYPLSDQGNKAGWEVFEPLCDEFEGKE
jgi:hypothetical protein